MMIGEITQENLYLLLPSKVSCLASMLQENDNMSLIDAIKKVYQSKTYKQMEQEVRFRCLWNGLRTARQIEQTQQLHGRVRLRENWRDGR